MNFERDDWVSCKDRLPDDQRNVLFVYHNPFLQYNELIVRNIILNFG